MNQTLRTIAQRYSCRSYDGSRTIEKSKLEAIAAAAAQSPSGMNNQPWRIVVITDKAFLDEMDAEAMKILAEAEDKGTYNRFMDRGGKLYYDAPCMFLILKRPGSDLDCGIVTQNIALAAESLGLANVIDASRSGRNNTNANLDQVLFAVGFMPTWTEGEYAVSIPEVVRRQVFDTYTGEYWEVGNNPAALNMGELIMPVPDYNEAEFVIENAAIITIVTPFQGNIIPTLPWTYGVRNSSGTVSTNAYGQFSVTRPHSRHAVYIVYFSENSPDYLQNHPLAEDYPNYIEAMQVQMFSSLLSLPDYRGREQVRELAHKNSCCIDGNPLQGASHSHAEEKGCSGTGHRKCYVPEGAPEC